MASVAEVKNIALRKLGVLRVGQTARAPDIARMDEAYDAVYGFLKVKGWATWASTGTVPAEVVEDMAYLMAMKKVDEYGVSNARYQRIVAGATAAVPNIRDMTAEGYESLKDPVDF